MTDLATTSESAPVATSPAPAPPAFAEIDASCRGPVMVLVVSAAAWLVVAGVLSVLASIKLHAPGMLAQCAWLTFGRVQPAAWNAFAFGFGSLAGLGMALWMTARLSAARLQGGGFVILGALVWNLGLLLGVLGILAGDSTGLEGLELPRYASPILLAGYLAMAPWALMTLTRRAAPDLYISQWYLIGALLSFPWLFVAGHAGAVFMPLRGVLQAAAQAWYLQNLYCFWFGFLGLAALYYFIPKLTGSAVPSRSLALFGFWTLLFFGGFGGLTRYAGGPFPAWMLSLPVTATVLTIFPAYATAANLFGALRGQSAQVRRSVPLVFAVIALWIYLIASLATVANALPSIRRVTQFTLFNAGIDQLLLVGFFGLAVTAALYFVVPRLLGGDWPSALLAKIHLICAGLAMLLVAAAFLVGGVLHGIALNDSDIAFIAVAKRYIPFASVGTLANLLLLVGSLAFAGNLALALVARFRAACMPVVKSALAPLPAEVRA